MNNKYRRVEFGFFNEATGKPWTDEEKEAKRRELRRAEQVKLKPKPKQPSRREFRPYWRED